MKQPFYTCFDLSCCRKRFSVFAGAFVLLALVSCAGTPSPSNETAKAGPDWVYDQYSVFPENRYVSAVGYGTDRESAEKGALGALVAVFGQSVKGETQANYRYTEAVAEGLIVSAENSEIQSAVRTSAEMDTLIGAEIKDTWYDGKETHYAVAVMEILKSAMLYSDLVEANLRLINTIVDIPEEDFHSFDSYARYMMAADVADANTAFLNVLSVLSPASAASLRSETKGGNDYRLAALSITQNIPIRVNVENDRSGRLKKAFSDVFAGAGFKTTDDRARYELNAAVDFSEVNLPQNPNIFVRYTIDAALVDTAAGNTLFPYNISAREGHVSLSEAENRALRSAEQKISASYGEAFSAYISRLSNWK